MEPQTTAGARIKLRDWELSDLPFFERWQQPGHEWQKLDGPYYKSPDDRSLEITAALKAEIADAKRVRFRLAIADAESDRLLGVVSSYWESKETFWLCAGIIIYDPDDWGKGLGFEALGLWTDLLFKTHPQIVRLDMRTWSGNRGLMRLAEKLGYLQEACFRKARIVDGQYFDGLGYGILKEEWQARYPEGFPL